MTSDVAFTRKYTPQRVLNVANTSRLAENQIVAMLIQDLGFFQHENVSGVNITTLRRTAEVELELPRIPLDDEPRSSVYASDEARPG